MKTIYVIQDREAGNEIEECRSYDEAERILKQFEETDRCDGNYTPDFYEIVEKDI